MICFSWTILVILCFYCVFASKPDFNYEEARKKPVNYQDGCHVDSRATTINPKCIYGSISSNQTIVLTGDSHAAQWFPAINKWAISRNFKLILMTKSSCPSVFMPIPESSKYIAKNCQQFRDIAFKEIRKLNPELVIVGYYEHYPVPVWYYRNPQFPFKALILRDTPAPFFDVPSCVKQSKLTRECDIPLPGPKDYGNHTVFNPLTWMCKSLSCFSVINDLIVFRDSGHITIAIAKYLETHLSNKLDNLLVYRTERIYPY